MFVISAAACGIVVNAKSSNQGAITSQAAAQSHGLKILNSRIGNDQNSETRYIIIAATSTNGGPDDPLRVSSGSTSDLASTSSSKSSIVLAMRNIPGAIFKMSSCFALRDIDIIKFETRPATTAMKVANLTFESRLLTEKHWNFLFYVDYVTPNDEAIREALLANLNEFCLFIKPLGTYKSGLGNVSAQPAQWGQMKDMLSMA